MLVDQRRSQILEIIEMKGFSALQDLVSEGGSQRIHNKT
ncbi:MAG: hypothetical protein Ct9H300mP1_03910 [Planctomycetaceae bacterium]|nr:MAG: hypothetical protein Ct9H300mP1_03910 [Planctomycetaceae bacterium]